MKALHQDFQQNRNNCSIVVERCFSAFQQQSVLFPWEIGEVTPVFSSTAVHSVCIQ